MHVARKVSTPTIAEQIAEHENALLALRQQQRAALLATIALEVGPGVVFSAVELWDRQVLSPELKSALFEAGIRSPRQLGKRLRQLCGELTPHGLERVGVDHNIALWMCSREHA